MHMINIKKKGRSNKGSDITQMTIIDIHSHFFSLIICCWKNIYNKRIVVGNPVPANRNIIELVLPLSVTSIFVSIPKKEFIVCKEPEEI